MSNEKLFSLRFKDISDKKELQRIVDKDDDVRSKSGLINTAIKIKTMMLDRKVV